MPIDAPGWMQYNANHSICFCYWKWLATRAAILNNLLPTERKNKNCYNIRCATRAHNVPMPYALRSTIRIHCHCSSQNMHTFVWLPVEPIHFDYLLSSFLFFSLLLAHSCSELLSWSNYVLTFTFDHFDFSGRRSDTPVSKWNKSERVKGREWVRVCGSSVSKSSAKTIRMRKHVQSSISNALPFR